MRARVGRSARCLSPLWHWNQVPPKDVQAALRVLFECWGLPERLRVDNGWPWGSSRDLPPFLALWLIGLGVGVIHNPPRSPERNAKVERFHGLVEPWGEPSACADLAAWQARLNWVVEVQRERYPSIDKPSGDKQTRLEAFPSLRTTERPYSRAEEPERWSLDLIKGYLATGRFRRRVDKVGRIKLYDRPYSVGRAYKGQDVFVEFAPTNTAWVFRDKAGKEIGRKLAKQITVGSIVNLEVSHHKHVPSAPASSGTTC